MAQSRLFFVVAVLVLALCEFTFAGQIRPKSNRHKRHDILTEDVFHVENPPTLVADFLFVKEDRRHAKCVDVLSNDKDTDGNLDLTSLIISTPAKNGIVYIDEETNEACYKPNPDFYGSDSFEYSVCDKTEIIDHCKIGLVRVHVAAKNDAPALKDDLAFVEKDQYSITVDVLANDEDVDGRYIRRSTFKVVVPPKYGRAELTSDKKIKYTPIWTDKVRFHGHDSLVYEICDNERRSLCSHATLTIEVRDKCIACEKCDDRFQTFNLHRDRVHYFYNKDVLSVPHH